MQVESEARAAAERDFLEISSASKMRILYLEQWKAGAAARLLRLQQRLEVSVPGHVRVVLCVVRNAVLALIVVLKGAKKKKECSPFSVCMCVYCGKWHVFC